MSEDPDLANLADRLLDADGDISSDDGHRNSRNRNYQDSDDNDSDPEPPTRRMRFDTPSPVSSPDSSPNHNIYEEHHIYGEGVVGSGEINYDEMEDDVLSNHSNSSERRLMSEWSRLRDQRRNGIHSDAIRIVHGDPGSSSNESSADSDDDDDLPVRQTPLPQPPYVPNLVPLENISSHENISRIGQQFSIRPLQQVNTTATATEPEAGPLDLQLVEEELSEAQKRETSAGSIEEEDGFICSICYEPFTNSGVHKAACLKCGHIFGLSCIERWLRNDHRCPQCNDKAAKKDVRALYVKTLKAIDTAERDRAISELEKEKEAKRKLELECSKLKIQNQMVSEECEKVKEENLSMKERFGSFSKNNSEPTPSTSTSTTSNFSFDLVKNNRFSFTKKMSFGSEECRVGAYSPWFSLFAVSQSINSPLYHTTQFGFRRINLLDMKFQSIAPGHQKQIRDLSFSPMQNDLLLSVGLDKKAILTNCSSKVVTQTYTASSPIWSCAWNPISQYMFYIGTQTGQVISYDTRTNQVCETINFASDNSPVTRIKYIAQNYQNPKSFSKSGLLVQKLNSCWFCESRHDDHKLHQLPIDGPFMSMDYESSSNHVLFATRPSNKKGGIYMVCELSEYYSEAQSTNICTCNILHNFQSENYGMSITPRATIFSPEEGKVMVVGNEKPGYVKFWDLSDSNNSQRLQTKDILDFVPAQFNDNLYVNFISKHELDMYKFN